MITFAFLNLIYNTNNLSILTLKIAFKKNEINTISPSLFTASIENNEIKGINILKQKDNFVTFLI